MAFAAAVPLIVSGISALSSLFGKKKQEQTQNWTQNSTQNMNSTYGSSVMPTYSGYEGQIKNYILGNLINRTQDDTGATTRSYLQGGIKNITSANNLKKAALRSSLAARGLGYSPTAAIAENALESGANSDIVNLENSIPLLQRQLQRESMSDLSGFFSSLPVGQSSSGYTSGTTTTNASGTGQQQGSAGGGTGEALSSLGQGLASTYGLNYWLQNLAKQQQTGQLSTQDILNLLTSGKIGG